MSDIKLPIEVISNTHPPRFRWRRAVNTIVGMTTVECEGCLPSSVEDAVIVTVAIAKQLVEENAKLKEKVEELLARLSVGTQQEVTKQHRRR